MTAILRYVASLALVFAFMLTLILWLAVMLVGILISPLVSLFRYTDGLFDHGRRRTE